MTFFNIVTSLCKKWKFQPEIAKSQNFVWDRKNKAMISIWHICQGPCCHSKLEFVHFLSPTQEMLQRAENVIILTFIENSFKFRF